MQAPAWRSGKPLHPKPRALPPTLRTQQRRLQCPRPRTLQRPSGRQLHHVIYHVGHASVSRITCVPIWQAIYYIASHVCPSGRQYITLHHMCAHLAGTDLERVPGRRSGSTSHTAHVSHMRITQCNITSRGPKRRPGCCSKLLPACGERCSICMRISPSMRVRL
jgi:hypothetical protein